MGLRDRGRRGRERRRRQDRGQGGERRRAFGPSSIDDDGIGAVGPTTDGSQTHQRSRLHPAIAPLATIFYLAHAAELLTAFPAANLLWSCNVGAAAICVGMWLRRPAPLAAGCFLLLIGNVIWLLDLAAGGQLLWTAPLTHVGLFALALASMRRLGLPAGTWWRALALLAAALAAARALGPPDENVNFAFSVPKGWSAFGLPLSALPAPLSPWAHSQPLFLTYIGLVFTLTAALQQRLLPRLGFLPPPSPPPNRPTPPNPTSSVPAPRPSPSPTTSPAPDPDRPQTPRTTPLDHPPEDPR